ncbi:myosin heavy chain, cardiac muscle isoform-like isoform X2 [Lepisosteus oculatus]|uniref:myosin heavy chain, cardiac muscle isoform-like isoform X2 n=1 Tax=Lepisosteus oculatus TaxID=7918 RepID=UPI0035F512F8
MFRRSFSFPVETRRLRIGLLCGNGGPAKSVQDLQACHAESPFRHLAEDLGSWEHLCRQNLPPDLSKLNLSDDRKGCTMAPVSIQQPSVSLLQTCPMKNSQPFNAVWFPGQVLLLGAFETPKDVTEDGSDRLCLLEEIVDTDSNGNDVNHIKESRFLETIESIYQLENDKQNDCHYDHLKEKEKVVNESNLSMASKSYNMAELVHARNRLAEENAEIQKSIEMTEETNAQLRSENTALKKQVKSIKQSILQAEELGVELEEVRSALSESSITNTKLKMSVKQLERENEILKDKIDCVTDEMDNMLSEREVDKKKIIHLGSMLKVLENQLEEERLALNQKDEIVLKKDFVIEQLKNSLSEYSSVVQDLRDKVKDLQNQLAEMQQEAALNAESVASGGFNDNVASEPSLGYELEQCTKEAKIDEEADDFGIVSGPFRSRLWQRCVRLKTAALSAGLLGLGFLLPLGVYTALMPTVQSHLGAPCSDSLWNAARHYLKPYCSLSHVTPPPW